MTKKQRESWDWKVTLAKACRDERPIPEDGDFESNIPDDLLIAADKELAELRRRPATRSEGVIGLAVAAIVSGLVCGLLGWFLNDLSRLG